ncbi:hypothetical protein [Rhizobium jaguaris]|uniref:hypothetical protein n=1 Tax=Rhizobium jaguaris TaxID=1312183 RepID=UPI0013C47DF5|nr:hypothetical protein [Rhizobium jaguaris]
MSDVIGRSAKMTALYKSVNETGFLDCSMVQRNWHRRQLSCLLCDVLAPAADV